MHMEGFFFNQKHLELKQQYFKKHLQGFLSTDMKINTELFIVRSAKYVGDDP